MSETKSSKDILLLSYNLFDYGDTFTLTKEELLTLLEEAYIEGVDDCCAELSPCDFNKTYIVKEVNDVYKQNS